MNASTLYSMSEKFNVQLTVCYLLTYTYKILIKNRNPKTDIVPSLKLTDGRTRLHAAVQ